MIHRLAMIAVGVEAVLNLLGILRNPYGMHWLHVVTPVVAIVLWCFLLRNLWMRPRQWGLRIGIFLLLMVAYQCWIYRIAIANPALNTHGATWPPFLLFGESPIFIAGVLCLLLRVYYPKAPSQV